MKMTFFKHEYSSLMTGKTNQAYPLIRKEKESFEDVRIEIFMEAIHPGSSTI